MRQQKIYSMLVPFSSLPDHSRVWIYPSPRTFTEKEKEAITNRFTHFLTQWTTHGSSLEAAYDLPYNQFIVIGLNEQPQSASGCSIDALVHEIQAIETELNLQLLDKMNVSYRDGNQLCYVGLKEFRKLAKTPKITPNTTVFNNLVINKSEYIHHWEVPAHASWHSRFIK